MHSRAKTTVKLSCSGFPLYWVIRRPNGGRSRPEFGVQGRSDLRIRSLSVKSLERRQHAGMLIGEVSSHAEGKIQKVNKPICFFTYGQALELQPGHYRLAFQVMTGDSTSRQKDRRSLVALVKQESNVLAVSAITCAAGQSEDHEFMFEVPSELTGTTDIEFLFQAVTAQNFTLRTLAIEPMATAIRQTGPAACELENWLPFLRTAPSARVDRDGIVVSEGRAEYCISGPYWTLPPGRYEVIASIVPLSSSLSGKPIITLDVAAERGQHRIAEQQWRLGQYQCGDAQGAAEIRLPFTLALNLPAASRKIETRIYSPGDAGFRLRSLAVRTRRDEPERNWFPYLIVGECGIHTGNEIKSIENKVGYIAYTLPMDIDVGHYEMFLDVVDLGTKGIDPSSGARIRIEVLSETDILAMQIYRGEF